jgi:hypothetical protein
MALALILPSRLSDRRQSSEERQTDDERKRSFNKRSFNRGVLRQMQVENLEYGIC